MPTLEFRTVPISFPPRRGAVMLQPPPKSSCLNVPAPKRKRGRPRKFIDTESLLGFETTEDTSGVTPEKQEKALISPVKQHGKRRLNPVTSDRNYTMDEIEFMNALAEFKRANGRTFPTCSEILNVLRSLGYEKHT